eukprot:m.7403 g.7403  ORF g.7403 m.7403 type:complete len:366 (+) comp5018_c1_seq1:94-1191(+)
MEFPFSVNSALPDTVTVLTASSFRTSASTSRGKSLADDKTQILDAMGQASAVAQKLKAPITSAGKLAGTNHKVYILKDSRAAGGKGTVLGLIKVGSKNLFITDSKDKTHEIAPLCVLDFYVHETCQRSGHGRMLFDHMIAAEGKHPSQLGYDRPSPKFVAFLAKHFGLRDFRPQINNFVVFNDYFLPPRPLTTTTAASSHPASHGISSSPSSSSFGAPPASRAGRVSSGVVPRLQLSQSSASLAAPLLPPRTSMSTGGHGSGAMGGGLAMGGAGTFGGSLGNIGGAGAGGAAGVADSDAARLRSASFTRHAPLPQIGLSALGGPPPLPLGSVTGSRAASLLGANAGSSTAGKTMSYSYNNYRKPF